MAEHDLKTWPEPFQAMWDGVKKADVRNTDDREYDEKRGKYTGRAIKFVITHIQEGFGLPDNVVVLSLSLLAQRSG